ncbi:MAG: beta strand repeat-containing protein, partial [Planctomycetia bacterium]
MTPPPPAHESPRHLACRRQGHAGILALFLVAVAASPASAQVWNIAGSGTWANGSANFTPSYSNSGPATFSNTAGGTITLSGTISPSSTTVSAGSGTYTFTGTGITAGSLSKSGAGTLILTNANTYSGNTTISGGDLQIGDGSNATARAGTGTLAVGGNTLSLNLSASGTLGNSSVTLTSAGQIRNVGAGQVTLANGLLGDGTINGGAAGIVLSNLLTDSLFLQGNVTFGASGGSLVARPNAPGATARIVNAGSFWWIGSETAANALSLDVASGVTLSLNASQGAGALYYNDLSGAGNFTYNSTGGTGFILGTSTLTGTVTAGNRSLSFGNGGSTGAAGATRIVATANVAFDSTTNNTYSGTMSGAGALVKNASNVLSITGANTYSGATTLNAGTLQIGDGGTTGSLSTSSAIGGSAGATLAFARSDTVTSGTHFASTIGGSINVSQMGSGTLVLNGANTYTGTTSVNAGTLQIGANGVTGSLSTSSVITGSAGARLAFARSDTVTQGTHFRSVIGGAMDVAQVGSGTLVLNGANTYTGTTRIVAGSLSIGGASALQSSTLDLNAADAGTISSIGQDSTLGGLTGSRNLDMRTRTLSIGNNNQSTTYSGTLSNGGLTKVGSGTLTLTAANAYAGTTSISGGVLQVGDGTNATARVGTGTLAVGSGTLSLNLSGDATLGNTSVTASAGGLIQNVGTGRVTLANGNFTAA